MNIFYLDTSPVRAAQAHCDSHVRKMIIESAQLLSTAHHVLGTEGNAIAPKVYKPTHINHPCAKWVREGLGNYVWLWTLGWELCKEYNHRWRRIHATRDVLTVLTFTPKYDSDTFTPPPLAMPDMYKCDDHVQAYRAYYQHGKSHLLTYTNRAPPEWLRAEGTMPEHSTLHAEGVTPARVTGQVDNGT